MELSSLNLIVEEKRKEEALPPLITYPFKEDTVNKPLTWEQAMLRLEQFGPNTTDQKKESKWYFILLRAIVHPFNILLTVLAIIAGATGDFITVVFMAAMVVLSTGLRFVQEWKSERQAKALKKLVQHKVNVIRQFKVPEDRDPTWSDVEKLNSSCGYEYEIDLLDIVPGDLVKMSAGDMIPGDVRLLESKDLFISQSALTGEAIPVEKFVTEKILSPEKEENTKVRLERPDLCFMGTSVVSGTATAIVEHTGLNTVFGEMAKEMAKRKPPNAFQKGIKRVSFMFIGIMACMGPTVFLITGLVHKNWINALLFTVAVCVGLTPEMLPMVVNANLARGALVMARKKTIIKRLEAIINFGAMDVLCTDKTGTLTQNQVVLLKHLGVDGQPAKLPLEMAFLNSYFQTGLKNLLDVAVINFYTEIDPHKSLASQFTKVDELPFDFVRRRMSVILEKTNNGEETNRMIISKGAVEEMLSICSHIESSDRVRTPLQEETLHKLKHLSEQLNADGLRIVAVGYKDLQKGDEKLESKELENNMIFVGFVAFLDPPKETTAPAIAELISKGIKVKVLTGDSPLVCKKVCEQVKLHVNGIVTSADLHNITDEELEILAESSTIFAKLAPLEKARVVRVLKKKHIVGFLGDGINDAPALREADVGISVDSAVDVAKEAAEIILLEKSLMVLVKGVTLGRVTYGNTMKYLKMAVSSNFGNVFSVTIASAWLPFIPMQPVQLLLQNLLYDFSQLAIPWDRCDTDFLMTPKRWTAKGLLKFMIFIGPLSSIFDMTTFSFMLYYYGCNTNTPEHQALLQSAWFVEGLITQTLIVHMIRSDKLPVIQSSASLPVVVGTVLCCACGIAIPFIPVINTYLGFTPLPGLYFAYLIAANIGYFILTQVGKMIYLRVFEGEWM